MTDSSLKALESLRSAEYFQWYVVPLLAFVIYVYITEVQKKNWNAVLVGLMFAAGEFAWEMFNALVLYISNYAPLWSAPKDSALIIFVGLNIEIYAMFSIAGVILVKSLPADKNSKIWGINNRKIIPLLWGTFCVFIEILLNQWGALVWDWWWWSWPHIYLILFVYIAPFYLMTWVYDTLSLRSKVIAFSVLITLDLFFWILFVEVLGWI